MKALARIAALILFLTCHLFVSAQFGTVVVFSPKGEKFTVYFGGSKQNSEPASRVEGSNPGGPSFKIKVVFEDPAVKEISKLVFNKPNSTMYFKVDRNPKGNFVLESTSTEWSDTPAEKVSETKSQTKEAPPAKAAEESKENKGTSGTAPAGGKGCSDPMSTPDFTASLAGISAQPFDGFKLSHAKKTAEKNCLLAEQVREILYVFDSESSRLSFAKFAYEHTYDPDQYSEVREALHSERSKDELDKYIASRKK